jgi:tRNA threonylcarbamoyladenosine biosynthesis protein TsaE
MILTIPDINAINESAEKILSAFPQARIFALYGDMGAGKTTLIKAFCKKLGVIDSTSSPTYAIVNQYNGREIVYHIDLYRLKTINEAFTIGIEEYLNSNRYCFIEWPEIIEPLLQTGTVRINITVKEDGIRNLTLEKI